MNFLSLDAKPKNSYHAQTLSTLVSRPTIPVSHFSKGLAQRRSSGLFSTGCRWADGPFAVPGTLQKLALWTATLPFADDAYPAAIRLLHRCVLLPKNLQTLSGRRRLSCHRWRRHPRLSHHQRFSQRQP